MSIFSQAQPAVLTLRTLSKLLGYPDAELRANLHVLREAIQAERALSSSRLAELGLLIDQLGHGSSLEVESAYVELFDRGRATSLHLFEHVHGDSRERGPAMIDLAQTYEKAGLYVAETELPDFLPVVLEFVSTQPAREARDFLGEIAHILNALFAALQQRNSAYASVLGALLELAGEKAHSVTIVPEESIDAVWEEPVVFDGCSVKGQSRPDQPQPIHIVRKDKHVEGTPT